MPQSSGAKDSYRIRAGVHLFWANGINLTDEEPMPYRVYMTC